VTEALLLGAVLSGLAVLDAGFAGFRAAAGREPTLQKWRSGYYPRAIRRGLLLGLANVLVVVALGAGLLLASPGWAPVAARAQAALLVVVGTYAAVVLLAFVPWLTCHHEVRSLTSVIVFGPLTLARGPVVGAGLALALWTARTRWEACLVLGVACALVLIAEPLLGVLGRRRGW